MDGMLKGRTEDWEMHYFRVYQSAVSLAVVYFEDLSDAYVISCVLPFSILDKGAMGCGLF